MCDRWVESTKPLDDYTAKCARCKMAPCRHARVSKGLHNAWPVEMAKAAAANKDIGFGGPTQLLDEHPLNPFAPNAASTAAAPAKGTTTILPTPDELARGTDIFGRVDGVNLAASMDTDK